MNFFLANKVDMGCEKCIVRKMGHESKGLKITDLRDDCMRWCGHDILVDVQEIPEKVGFVVRS